MFSPVILLLVFVQCLDFSNTKEVFENVIKQHHRERRDTVASESRKWPGGIVPYVFGYSASYQAKIVFNQAKLELERISCVKFVERTTEEDYVRIISSPSGCYSIIGRDGGRQDLSLGDGCHTKGIALHETLHTLGFYHEQSRRDRDKHVIVNVHNAIKDVQRQFDKYKPGEADTQGEKYDADSIMHYSNRAFSKNGKNTIVYRFNPTKKLGQRERLTEIDIRQLNKLYRCHHRNKNESTNLKTTQPPNIDTCRDNAWAGFQCFFQSMYGGCYFYPQQMNYLCPKTCGFCKPTCFDRSRYCDYFAYHGYCSRSATIQKRCRKTCKICRII